jgi:hypothetical protein
MADSVHRVYLWSIATIALAAGCILTATTVNRLAGCRARMERRMADYKSLAELDAKLRHMETAMATWQDRAPGPPAPVSVLATNIFNDLKVEMREIASSNAAPGLVARRIEVVCMDAPFDRAMQLVQRLDGLWPRWVLVHLEIKSTDQAGKGRVLMRFESISSATAVPAVTQTQPPETVPAIPPEKPMPPASALYATPAPGGIRRTEPPIGEPPNVETAATNAMPPRGWLRPPK